MTSDEAKAEAFSERELLDGILGRFIHANLEAQQQLITDMRKLLLKSKDRRAYREDARIILQHYASGAIDDDKTLDLLGFGEPIDSYGPRAQP